MFNRNAGGVRGTMLDVTGNHDTAVTLSRNARGVRGTMLDLTYTEDTAAPSIPTGSMRGGKSDRMRRRCLTATPAACAAPCST